MASPVEFDLMRPLSRPPLHPTNHERFMCDQRSPRLPGDTDLDVIHRSRSGSEVLIPTPCHPLGVIRGTKEVPEVAEDRVWDHPVATGFEPLLEEERVKGRA